MTFLGKDQRQHVVVAAGGGSYLGAAPGSKILAFALPAILTVDLLLHHVPRGVFAQPAGGAL